MTLWHTFCTWLDIRRMLSRSGQFMYHKVPELVPTIPCNKNRFPACFYLGQSTSINEMTHKSDTCFCRLNHSSLQHRWDKGYLGKRTDHIQGLIKCCCHDRAFQIHLILHRQTPARHAGTVPWPHLTDPRQWPHPEVLAHTARQQAAISTDHNVYQREKNN